MKLTKTEDTKGFNIIDNKNNYGICIKIVPKFEFKIWSNYNCGIKMHCITIGKLGIGIGIRKNKLT